MKKYEFDIGQSYLELFFPKKRIKTKIQVLEILLEATRFMLVNHAIERKNIDGKIILIVDKMSRLFFFKNERYYSIVFPFYVNEIDNLLHFSFQNDIEVDAHLISNIFSIIKCETFKDKCSLDFAEPIYDYENEFNENFWVFLRELLLFEDGYIRYDKDTENYQLAKGKGEEHKHPLYHFDFFYSSNATFKIGLEKELIDQDFIELLDINTDCKYI